MSLITDWSDLSHSSINSVVIYGGLQNVLPSVVALLCPLLLPCHQLRPSRMAGESLDRFVADPIGLEGAGRMIGRGDKMNLPTLQAFDG